MHCRPTSRAPPHPPAAAHASIREAEPAHRQHQPTQQQQCPGRRQTSQRTGTATAGSRRPSGRTIEPTATAPRLQPGALDSRGRHSASLLLLPPPPVLLQLLPLAGALLCRNERISIYQPDKILAAHLGPIRQPHGVSSRSKRAGRQAEEGSTGLSKQAPTPTPSARRATTGTPSNGPSGERRQSVLPEAPVAVVGCCRCWLLPLLAVAVVGCCRCCCPAPAALSLCWAQAPGQPPCCLAPRPQ